MIADDEASADETEKAEHNGSQSDTEGEAQDKEWISWRVVLPDIEGIPMMVARMFHFLNALIYTFYEIPSIISKISYSN